MNLSYKFRGGTYIVFIEDDVGLSWFFLKERCKIFLPFAIRHLISGGMAILK